MRFRSLLRKAALFLLLGGIFVVGALNFITVPGGHVILLDHVSRGILPEPLTAGRHWLPDYFLPGQYRKISIPIHSRGIMVQFSRPLLEVAHLRLGDGFTVRIPVVVQMRVDTERVLYYYNFLDRNPENLPVFLQRVLDEPLFTAYDAWNRGNIDGRLDAVIALRQKILPQVLEKTKNELAERGILLENLSLGLLENLQLPILTVAEKEKFSLLTDFLARKKEESLAQMRRETEVQFRQRQSEWQLGYYRSVGQLLQTYPELLKYIEIDKLAPNVAVKIVPDSWSSPTQEKNVAKSGITWDNSPPKPTINKPAPVANPVGDIAIMPPLPPPPGPLPQMNP